MICLLKITGCRLIRTFTGFSGAHGLILKHRHGSLSVIGEVKGQPQTVSVLTGSLLNRRISQGMNERNSPKHSEPSRFQAVKHHVIPIMGWNHLQVKPWCRLPTEEPLMRSSTFIRNRQVNQPGMVGLAGSFSLLKAADSQPRCVFTGVLLFQLNF